MFHALSRVVNEARSALVVLDTAPTGHSLLLMDATGAYRRQMTQQYEGSAGGKMAKHIITPVMRLLDADMTHVVIVTRPEVTPVSQAAAPQDDLRRAEIEPWAWVINKSVAATCTSDPLLQARLVGERLQAARIANGLAQRTCVALASNPAGGCGCAWGPGGSAAADDLVNATIFIAISALRISASGRFDSNLKTATRRGGQPGRPPHLSTSGRRQSP